MATPLVAAAAVTTSPESTRIILLACIVTVTVLFLVFVAHKMRQRVRLGCCGIGEGAQAERAAVLALAAQLYRAAAANPATRPRPLAGPAGWGHALPPSYLPPTLAPEEVAALRSPRSPAAATAHLAMVTASSPWSHASELSHTSPQSHEPQQQGQQGQQGQQPHLHLPPRPPRPRPPSASPSSTVRDGSMTTNSAAGSRGAPQGREPGAPPLQRWPMVRELVCAWSRSRSNTEDAEASSSGTGAADVLASGAAAGGTGQDERASFDLESQKGAAPCQLPEARAFTWSQLGISPVASQAGSRRASESAGSAPPPRRPPSELHAVSNPVFSPYDWAHHGAAAGAADATAASFSHQLRRQPSRLARAASFADPGPAASDPASAVVLAVAAVARAWGGAGEAGSWEGSSHHSRRSNPHPDGSMGGWAAELQGAGMRSRLSQQSLLHSVTEGLGRIKE